MSNPKFLAPEREMIAEIRDELHVQAELGKAELRDGLHELEHKWHQFQAELDAARRTAEGDVDEVRASAELLMNELREGYEHLRDRIKHPLA